ncbi:hypothetical protein CRG98_002550, partial [Punica granatum]
MQRWETGIRTDILEFQGGLQPEEFLDWLATVEEVLEFNGVPGTKRVQLVATQLRGRVSTWWQQRALIIERQQKRTGSGVFGGGVVVAGTGGAVRAGGNCAVPGRPMRPANIGPSSSGAKCFKFYVAGGDGEVEFDKEEEIVTGDGVPNPVVRRSCMTPRAADEDWLCNNIFESTYTIGNKVCRFMIDSGSCENFVSAEAVQKLSLQSRPHPKPYKLAWLKKGSEVNVLNRALVTFSIGPQYRDSVWCDVVIMDACHLLLGRPWQFDKSVSHDGRTNKYNFMHKGLKIVL